MKKSLHLLILFTFFLTGTAIGQKVKFKSKICKAQKVRLPTHYAEPDKRTYDLIAKGRYSSDVDPNSRKLYGWEKNNSNPSLKGVVSIYGYSISAPKLHSEKKERKDKEGNVVERWTEYHYTNKAVGKATLYVYGVDNPFEYNKKSKDPSKKSKAEERKEAEEKALASNPFLSAAAAEEAGESDVGEDEGIEEATLSLVTVINVDKETHVKSETFRSSKQAYEDYVNNHRDELYTYKSEYPTAAYRSAIGNLNRMYGYSPYNNRFYMKQMKSDKHPEFKMWNDACQATTTLFKTLVYNKSIEDKQKQFDPIIDYFADQVNRISEGDKKQQKLKKIAFTNLTNILYYLDRHDEVITWSKKFLDSKKLDRVSKRMLERSEREKAHLAFHNMTTRHVEIEEKVLADDIESEEVSDTDTESN